MLYSYRGTKEGYSKAIVGGIKYLIEDQPKDNLTAALKQTQKAASKATAQKPAKGLLITKEALGLAQHSYTASKNSNLTFINLTAASIYNKAILDYSTSIFILPYFQYNSKTITILLILTFSRYSYNNNNNNNKYSNSRFILYLLLSYNSLTQGFPLLLKGNYIT